MNNNFEAAKFELEPKFEKTINEITDNHLKSIASAAMNLSDIASFKDNFDPLSMNNSFEAEKLEPEPKFENNIYKIKDHHLKSIEPETTFEKTINDIKSNYLKSITSIEMNVSAITSNKPSLSSEHLKSYFVPWILLRSQGKSPQFANHLSSIYPNGNTQLKIRKWRVHLRSALYLFSFWSYFCQHLSIISTRCPRYKTIKERVHFFKTIIIHAPTAPISNFKLKRVSEVYHLLYNNITRENTMPK